MNEFVEQFLLEARELVEQAVADLLALEEDASAKDRLDSAFRAFHTLKGAAGIVDFAAMVRALHAAEDVLSRVRSGEAAVTPALISDALGCLDQVAQWLDAMQATGEPPASAEAAAEAIILRFGGPAVVAPLLPFSSGPANWVGKLLGLHAGIVTQASSAIRYAPDADCFFHGEDPAALMRDLPGLLALEIDVTEPRPVLDAFDPFACRLMFTALSSTAAGDLELFLRTRRVSAEVHRLDGTSADLSGGPLSPEGRGLLAAQVSLLAEAATEGWAGRVGSAGRVAANVLLHAGRQAEADRIGQALVSSQASGDPNVLGLAIQAFLDSPPASERIAPMAGFASPMPVEPPTPLAPPAPIEPGVRTLRVDVDRVDALAKLTGELTVLKNALGHTARLSRDGMEPKTLTAMLRDQHALLERLTAELQQSVLSIRVLPLRHVFQRFPRLVREMAGSLGKSVRLVTEGDATEADKAIVERLFEPLLHTLRNAVDHGAEPERERAAAGKPPVATIRLRGARQGNQVLIEVEDDGRGIDVARVRAIAATRGLASAEALAAMPDMEVVDLIFTPGFSTASAVTSLSGRGVGMDAVRSGIESLGGRVTLDSQPGHGTRVRLTLPFTVMMTRLMTVEAGGQLFGIPMDAVIETTRIPHDRIGWVGAARVVVQRNRTIPLIGLAEALGEPRPAPKTTHANVVIVDIDTQLGGLEVDRFGERVDVMLKPMDGLLSGLRGIAGTSLLGDGRVLLVLDLPELLQ